MKYSVAAIALVAASATMASAVSIKDANIVCQHENLDQLRVAKFKDVNANKHPQAIKAGLVPNPNSPGNVNIIASEGLIGVDSNNVFYELYNDPASRAVEFYVQQCNSTSLNANQGNMKGDLPIKLLSKTNPNLCASAINHDAAEGQDHSTPVQLKPCLGLDSFENQASQFWVQKKGSDSVQFLGNKQNGSQNYWYSETGGGNSYRTPNVMQQKCKDQACQDGAINWQLV